jgi:hypothetical protein
MRDCIMRPCSVNKSPNLLGTDTSITIPFFSMFAYFANKPFSPGRFTTALWTSTVTRIDPAAQPRCPKSMRSPVDAIGLAKASTDIGRIQSFLSWTSDTIGTSNGSMICTAKSGME